MNNRVQGKICYNNSVIKLIFYIRCIKFNITCTYTVVTSPKDIEYIQELEYMKQIETIQQQISCMENELSTMKLAQETDSPAATISEVKAENNDSYYDYPSPVSLNSTQDYIPKSSHRHHHHHSHHNHSDDIFRLRNRNYCRHGLLSLAMDMPGDRMIAKCKSIEAIVSKKKEEQPWTLTVKNGNMSIETHINSHADLMSHMEGMISTCLYQKSTSTLPFPFFQEPWAPKNAIGAALGIIIWRKYGKSRFKSLTGYTPTLIHYKEATRLTKIAPTGSIENITIRLVYTYINCLHVKTFFIHVPSFIRLFMIDEEHVIKSPAVMALCSLICHQNCKHVRHVIPNEALTDYGFYYFEQARELISEQFDEANLETLFTFTFMAAYKLMIKNDDEGDRYLCIAERIYNILLPQYKFQDGVPHPGESILFSRIYRCLHHSRAVIRLHRIMEGMHRSRSAIPKMTRLMENLDDDNIYIAKDDSPRETRFIQMNSYLNQLRESIKHGIGNISAEDFPTFIGLFGHQVEMAMRHWYRNILPLDFQLQIPLFEDASTDIEFFTNLELECGDSPIPILITLSLYNEYLIMSKSYLPKRPDDVPPNTEELVEKFKEMQNHIHKHNGEHDKMYHWFKMIEKMTQFRNRHDDHYCNNQEDKLNDQDIAEFVQALNLSEVNFNMPFIHTSVAAALNLVRLVQFLLSRDFACFLDLRWVMNAWQLLLRAAKFKYQQPGDDEVTLDRIRANLILCLNIIRDQLKSSRRDSSGSFIDDMEQEFNKLF